MTLLFTQSIKPLQRVLEIVALIPTTATTGEVVGVAAFVQDEAASSRPMFEGVQRSVLGQLGPEVNEVIGLKTPTSFRPKTQNLIEYASSIRIDRRPKDLRHFSQLRLRNDEGKRSDSALPVVLASLPKRAVFERPEWIAARSSWPAR